VPVIEALAIEPPTGLICCPVVRVLCCRVVVVGAMLSSLCGALRRCSTGGLGRVVSRLGYIRAVPIHSTVGLPCRMHQF